MNQDQARATTHQSWRLWLGLAFIAIALASLALSWFGVDWDEVLAAVQEHRQHWQGRVDDHIWLAAGLYFLIYVVWTAVSLPGALIFTLVGGAFFGLWRGVIVVSFASTLGATLAFLSSRFLLRDWVQQRYGQRLRVIQTEMDLAGGYYLLALRLNPVIPFFIINLLFGLTRISVIQFWWISQVGMFPATIIYTNAGEQLANISTLRGILSWQVIVSLIALGLFPLAARKLAQWLGRK